MAGDQNGHRLSILAMISIWIFSLILSIDSIGANESGLLSKVDDGLWMQPKNGTFDKVINGSVSAKDDVLERYKYEMSDPTKVVRIWVESVVNSTMDHPLLVVIRHPKAIISWQLPLPLDNDAVEYHSVSRTLCPPNLTELVIIDENSTIPYNNPPMPIYVELSTSSEEPIQFSLKATLMADFLLKLNERKQVSISPSEPQYFGFIVPEGMESVVLHVRSNDSKCMVVSVQSTKCPVFDLDMNVLSIGTYQTMTTRSAISLLGEKHKEFFVVFVVKPDDHSCVGGPASFYKISPSPGKADPRTKTIEVWIENAVSYRDYYIAIGITLTIFAGIYLITFGLWGLFIYRDHRDPYLIDAKQQVLDALARGEHDSLAPPQHEDDDDDDDESPLQETDGLRRRATNKKFPSYGAVGSAGAQQITIDESPSASSSSRDESALPPTVPPPSTSTSTSNRPKKKMSQSIAEDKRSLITNSSTGTDHRSIDELANAEDGLSGGSGLLGAEGLQGDRQQSVLSVGNSDEYDTVPDAEVDKSIIRIKPRLHVSDLARKPFKKLNYKYSMYGWNLVTISIFYTLPVIQLVITYQTVVTVTGNEDLCYYNFECARPLGAVFAFNTVFSNIGYVLFGVLFLIMVKIRDVKHTIRMKDNEILETKFGIPRHYGLFYAMGIALVMEGILSASYHICPNYTNFQFDTAFMYMIAVLCLLKIYQIRHPDINAHSHVAYAVMAMVILIAVIGVVYNSIPIWVVFSIVFIILLFMMSAEFYYKSQWKIDRGLFQRLRQEWNSSQGCDRFRPMYPERMLYLILCNAMNLAFIIWGLIERPKSFATFLVIILISNLMLYMLFYVAMKLRHGERLKKRTWFLGLMAAMAWGGSFVFFLEQRISWMKTPALSRELNEGCVLFSFYDTHDIWHFLSSLALFLSFMLTMIMDDDLKYTPQDKIAVF